jgi:serine/threonine-protein kinase
MTAGLYAAYLILLTTSDVLRISPLGFSPQFHNHVAFVSSVEPGSGAEHADLRSGDLIRRVNGQVLESQADWERVGVHFRPSELLIFEIDRAGVPLRLSMRLESGVHEWFSSGARPGVLVFRLAQAVTLALAVLVAFRRWYQPTALLGALLLASLASISLALPWRMAVFWDRLPEPLGMPLWLPYTSAGAAGPLLFAFAAVFPRRLISIRALTVQLAPAAAVVVWHLYAGLRIMGDLGPPTGVGHAAVGVGVANVLYAGAALALFVAHWQAAPNVTDRRRIGVLTLGTAVSALAAVLLLVSYGRNPGPGVFATPYRTLLSLVVLAMPAAFAYAILRHRLFDVRLIVRQGLRYALARRSVKAVIPVLGGLVLTDLLVARDQSIGSLLQTRWWLYSGLVAALLVVRAQREKWLRGIDRRFFREQYDAQRLLTSIAEQVSRAPDFDAIASSLVDQVEKALHPTFVTVLRHQPAKASFAEASGGLAASGSAALPASLTVVRVLSALRKPLALSLGATAWVRHQLPLEERTLLLQQGIELLVPISGRARDDLPLALLVLGPRRSEEPYSQDDLDLLTTIAHAVGVLLERSDDGAESVAECDRCGRCFDAGTSLCEHDGTPLSRSRGTRLINGRYRLECRLGRGGMGTVYSAADTLLERRVAVKVIRDELKGPLDLAARFRHEAKAAASFAHPHVVRVYDFGVDRGGRLFLVMELLEGSTLREQLARQGRLGAVEVLHIMRGVCSALSAAHAHGFVHRDLKPENIFLQRHPGGAVPKVLDFGLAKMLDAGASAIVETGIGTTAGMLVGTLEYMAPEQVAGGEVGPGWDVWALTVIAYEMLAGRHPFRRGVVVGLTAGAEQHPSAPAPEWSPLPARVEAFFHRGLSPDGEDRPADPEALIAALEQVLA